MKIDRRDPPREFIVGGDVKITIRDCGNLALAPDEQVTFLADGAEYDVVRKDWGFYATPSLDGRLEQFGLRTVLIRNTITGRYFVLLVQRGREALFEDYMAVEKLEVIAWLDSRAACDAVKVKLQG